MSEALYRQIYERFRGAIAGGTLKAGDRVPSVRALMKELGVARGTVDTAYALLIAEGYLQPRGQAGTIVTPGIKPQALLPVPPPLAQPREPSFRPESVLPFQMGLPALDEFPRKIWARLGARCLRSMQAADMVHPPVYGLPELRTEIAAYLQVARGIDCLPSQVFITSGYRHTLALIGQTLLKHGDRVWLENPGYPPTQELLQQMKIEAVPVPVDEAGMVVAEGIRLAPRARAAVVTPAHQSPLSVSLSLPRRQALLDWAGRHDAWIIEDDYDGEYRYVSRPLPSLKSLDCDGRVLYAGTFSKVLMPGIRLAYLVVPEAQVAAFERTVQLMAGGSPELTQSLLAAFMREGHFVRHIQRMRKLYAERRVLVVEALESVLHKHVSVDAQPGGMHLILRLNAGQKDRQLVARMLDAGLYAEAMSDWMVAGSGAHAGGSTILLGFTNIGSSEMAVKLGRRILKLMA